MCGTLTPDGKNTLTALGEYELCGAEFWFDSENCILTEGDYETAACTFTTAEKNVILGENANLGYWLANRGYFFAGYERDSSFGCGFVQGIAERFLSVGGCFKTAEGGRRSTRGSMGWCVRPVISILE